MKPTKNIETSPEALKRREWRSEIGLMDPPGTWHSDNSVAVVMDTLGILYTLSLKILGFICAEIISGAHDVCPIRVDLGVEIHPFEHVEHLSCMTTTSKDYQHVGRRSPWTAFGGNGILGDREGDEQNLGEMNNLD